LLRKDYTPIERAQVQALLKEQEFQASDLTTDEGAARAGQILNVPVVLVVNIPDFGEQMSMTAKMIDVEDGSVLWAGSGVGRTGRTLLFGSDSDDKTKGGIGGGVLGGVAGEALAPQQAKQVYEIIKKMCQSLPYRLRRQ
jgi:hypothetical protein